MRTAVHLRHQHRLFHSFSILSYSATTTFCPLHMMDNVHLLSQGLPLVGQAFIDREQFGEMLQIEIEVLSLDQLLNLSFQ